MAAPKSGGLPNAGECMAADPAAADRDSEVAWLRRRVEYLEAELARRPRYIGPAIAAPALPPYYTPLPAYPPTVPGRDIWYTAIGGANAR